MPSPCHGNPITLLSEAEACVRAGEVERGLALVHAAFEAQRRQGDADQVAEDLELLGVVGRELTANLDIAQAIEALHRALAHLMDAPTVSIWLFNDARDALDLRFGIEMGQRLPRERVVLDDPDSNVARCIREEREVLMALQPGERDLSHIAGTQRMLTALFGPLRFRDRVIGVLTIQSPRANVYGQRERLIFKTLCSYGAIALGNGEVYRAAQEAQAQIDDHSRRLAAQVEALEETRTALKASETRYRSVIENVTEAIIIYQGNRTVFANARASELTGFSNEELLSLVFPSNVHPEDMRKTADWVARHHRHEEVPRYLRMRCIRKDGTVVLTQVSMAVMEWNGRPATLGFFSDLTEHQRAEEAVRRSEERYRKVVTSGTEGILVLQDGEAVFINPRLEAMIGGTPADFMGRPFVSWLHAEDVGPVRQALANVAQGTPMGSLRPVRIRDMAGRERWIATSAATIEWNNRPAILAFVNDVTEQKRMEAAQKDREALISKLLAEQAAVFENAPLGMMITGDGVVIRVNSRLAALLERPAEAIVGGPVSAMFPSRAVETFFYDSARPALLAGKPASVDLLFDQPGGQRNWVRASIMRVAMEGYANAFITTVEEITERKLLELRERRSLDDAVRAREHADAASRAKSEFLAMMSHELRTPIAAVIGMQGFALRDDSLSARTREQIQTAQSNAQGLLTILNDLLDFSKIEAGKLAIECIDFHLGQLLSEVVTLLDERAASKSLSLQLVLDPHLPVHVNGDPTRLRQVLVNLIGNALKFTEHGGVTVHAQLRGRTDALNQVALSVQDTGIGIGADAISRLFQKFEQADASTTRRYGGTGLGLAISSQLVNLMDGQIEVESTEGVGSTFRFVLPLPDGQAPVLKEARALVPHTHRLAVLCAEDFPTNQIIIRTLLEDMGHVVTLVEDGQQALEAISVAPFDLILMDGRMPRMDGASATRAIRAGGSAAWPVAQKNVLIVALTANASADDRVHYLKAGMDEFLAKPVDEAALHELLANVIQVRLRQGVALPPLLRTDVGALDALFGLSADGPWASPPERVPEPPPARSAVEVRGDLQARMAAAFSQDLPRRLVDLEQALASRDADAASMIFHGLKGSTGYLEPGGELHLLTGAAMHAAERGDWAGIADALPRLRALLAAWSTPLIETRKVQMQ